MTFFLISPSSKILKISFILWGITLNKMKNSLPSKTSGGETVHTCVRMYGDLASANPDTLKTRRGLCGLISAIKGGLWILAQEALQIEVMGLLYLIDVCMTEMDMG